MSLCVCVSLLSKASTDPRPVVLDPCATEAAFVASGYAMILVIGPFRNSQNGGPAIWYISILWM